MYVKYSHIPQITKWLSPVCKLGILYQAIPEKVMIFYAKSCMWNRHIVPSYSRKSKKRWVREFFCEDKHKTEGITRDAFKSNDNLGIDQF
jgi:hypothetical protein